MNKPYVTQYNADGTPITLKKNYPSGIGDRNLRRNPESKKRTGLIIYQNSKDIAFYQWIPLFKKEKVADPENPKRKVTVKKCVGYKRIYQEMPADSFSRAKQHENKESKANV